ncbi:MAG: HAMP domain-containing sensor histidine kinase [Acidimicrobiia bacterium]
MVTVNSGTLRAAQTDVARVHRRVVRVGAAAAWFSAAVFLLAGFATGNDGLFIQSVGPMIAAGFMTAQIMLHREDGSAALLVSAIVLVATNALVGIDETLLPSALALVAISSVGMLFVIQNQLSVLLGVGLLLIVTPQLWTDDLRAALALGLVMGLSFAVTSVAFTTVRNAATAHNERFRILFDRSPTAVLEEDWSEAAAYVRSEYAGRPERIRQFLLSYPEVVRNAVSRAQIVRVNQAALDLLEANGPEDLLGCREASSVNRSNMDSFVDALVALYQGREIFEHEFFTHTFRGRPVWLQARCVDNTSGANPDSVMVALADISHLRAREEALADLIRAKDAFIASISHELRTPLTAVVGLSAEMTAGAMSQKEKDELMQLILDQSREMTFIVEDLLVAARAEIGTVSVELVRVDLLAEVNAALESVDVGLQPLPESLPTVLADPARVRQILRNLLTNLNRYGGSSRRVIGAEKGGRAWVEVRDDGAGVSPVDSERIFEPYSSAHTGVTGSVGLGLSVARQLAELMGGSLTYRRDQGESVFRLELPLADIPVFEGSIADRDHTGGLKQAIAH